MRSFLKRILKDLYFGQKRIFIRLTILFVKFIRPNLTFAYDANKVRDGVGAQLHRILSLSLVSFLCNLRMVRPGIEGVTIHPLDPIQDPILLERYLTHWNKKMFSSEKYVRQVKEISNCRIDYLESLNLKKLFLLSLNSKFSKVAILIYTKESHSISDYCVEKYKGAIGFYFSEFLEFIRSQQNSSELIVHYRQGAGGFVIHPGQRISRQMTIESVIYAIESISKISMARIKKLRLFTDSPKDSFRYSPIQSQLHLWQGMPGFDGKSLANKSSGIEKQLIPVAEKMNLLFSVEREIDAFQMIVAMARSEVLVTSRSSLSYVGGLFNCHGEILYPAGFWHTKLKSWKTYK